MYVCKHFEKYGEKKNSKTKPHQNHVYVSLSPEIHLKSMALKLEFMYKIWSSRYQISKMKSTSITRYLGSNRITIILPICVYVFCYYEKDKMVLLVSSSNILLLFWRWYTIPIDECCQGCPLAWGCIFFMHFNIPRTFLLFLCLDDQFYG